LRGMNAGSQRGLALELRQRADAEQFRKEADRARETAKKMSRPDRAFWIALAANWEKLATEAEAPKIRPWST
jgi:hypothetical protein